MKRTRTRQKRKHDRKSNTDVSLIYEESSVCEDIDGHEDGQLNGSASADATAGDCEALRH